VKIMSMPRGKCAREWGKYRESRNGQVGVATVEESQADIETLNVTASGNTEILPAPGSTEKLVIKGFHFSNDNSSKVTVSLRAGTTGKDRFSTVLAANGGNFDKNLIGRNWELPINTPLIVNLDGASDVFVTVEYEGGAEPGQEGVNLSDSLSIAEAPAKEVATPLADSQTLSASVANSPAKPLSDTIDFAESNTRTGDRVIALSDSEPIVESVGNQTTASLAEADSLDIAEQIEVTLIP
jgi:hypothetical protein